VGGLGQTGSTYGLRFLLAEVMPQLREVMAGIDYEVHLVGGGQVVPGLRGLVDQPRLVKRGYVEDIDAEMRAADALMVLNNAGRYLASYTRHMVAWSMGMCLVVHSNSGRPIPELVPGENALAGANGLEVARAIRLAVTDAQVAARVRREGRATYERCFAPDVVAGRLAKEMRAAVGSFRGRAEGVAR
jgi:glycosyltransferase involved in cell wall biosynthesis